MSVKDIQPQDNPKSKFYWEMEETRVQQRQKLRYRVQRLFSIRNVILISLLSIFVFALTDAQFMTTFLSIAGTVIELVLFMSMFLIQFVFMFWFLARTRAYTIMPGSEGVGFEDYRGQPEILEQAEQIITLLRGVKVFEGAGGEPLKGLLLEGPPGTGKTLLAKVISTEAGVPFFYMDASGLQAMFIGVGPMKVMRLYANARKAAKEYGAAVIFLDEIDAVGGSRGGVSSTNDQGGGGFGGMSGGGLGVLSTLLIELDGFNQGTNWRARLRSRFYRTLLRREPPKIERRVLTIGATNRMSVLDPALLRAGRFDKKLRVDVPDMEGRRDIFDYYLSHYAHDDSMDSAILATETPGYTPADIKYVLNEALRYAFFDGRDVISYHDFMHAQPEHEMGLRAPLKHISHEARLRLAYHEAGHAVAVRLFLPQHRIARITIIRQGLAFGHVVDFPARESFQGLQTKAHLMNDVRTSLAGKAAEIEFCGLENQTLGVGADFAFVLNRLGQMAVAGMFETMGAGMGVTFDMFQGVRLRLTPEQSRAIEEVYQKLLVETRTALRENAHVMEALVALLMEKQELLADEIRDFFDQYGLFTPDPTYIRGGEEISVLPPGKQRALPPTAGAEALAGQEPQPAGD